MVKSMNKIIEKLNRFQSELADFKGVSPFELAECEPFCDLVWLHLYDYIKETPKLHSELENRALYFDNLFKQSFFGKLDAEIEAIVDVWFDLVDAKIVEILDEGGDFHSMVNFYAKKAFKNTLIPREFGFFDYKNLYKVLQKTQYFDIYWAEYSPVFAFLESTQAMFQQMEAKYDFVFLNFQLYKEKMKEFNQKRKELFELCSFIPKKLAVFEFAQYLSVCGYKRDFEYKSDFQLEKCNEFLNDPKNYKELYRITARVLEELRLFCSCETKLRLKLCVAEQRAVFDDKELDISGTSFETLLVMAKAPEKYHTIDELYPLQSTNKGQIVRTNIRRIRQATYPDFVKNKVQIGYKLALTADEIDIC